MALLMEPEDKKAIMGSFAGYACKVANMVSLSVIFKDVPAPPTPEGASEDESEQEEVEPTDDARGLS